MPITEHLDLVVCQKPKTQAYKIFSINISLKIFHWLSKNFFDLKNLKKMKLTFPILRISYFEPILS